MKSIKSFVLPVMAFMAVPAFAAAPMSAKNVIYINSDVTTHVIMPENIKLVDISTPHIIGNQCADNMIRIKPVTADSVNAPRVSEGAFLGTVSIIGERHIVQYDVNYTNDHNKANSIFNVTYDDTRNYTNQEVAMPESEMYKLAWSVYGSKRKFNGIRARQAGISGEVYNIYSMGNYFFVDVCLKNHTKIPYDIAEIRVSLSDKKQVKSTNYQSIELTPLLVLNNDRSFKKDYRQVLVFDKLTFPEEKVMTIEFSEDQISGRTLQIPINYNDILNADGLVTDKDSQIPVKVIEVGGGNGKEWKTRYDKMRKDYDDVREDNVKLTEQIVSLSKQLNEKEVRLKKLSTYVNKIKSSYQDNIDKISSLIDLDPKSEKNPIPDSVNLADR